MIGFDLFYEHFDTEGQKIHALLNFYQVSFKRNMNTLHLKEFKQGLKLDKYPMLRVQ